MINAINILSAGARRAAWTAGWHQADGILAAKILLQEARAGDVAQDLPAEEMSLSTCIIE